MQNVGLLGKIPTHGDFLRHGAAGSSWRAMDEWVQHGLYHAQHNPDFDASYKDGDGYAFLFSPPDTATALLGYMQPSKDAIGRTFPLILATELEAHLVDWDWLIEMPCQYHVFLQRARELAGLAASGAVDRHRLFDSLVAMNAQPLPLPDFSTITIRSFSEQIWPPSDRDRLFLLFLNLTELIQPLRGQVPDTYTLGFRFPAPQAGEMSVQHTSFWLQALYRLLDRTDISPTCFWRLPGPDRPSTSSLLAFLRRPSPRAFGDFVPVEKDSDHICDMDRINEKKRESAPSLLPGNLKAVLEDGGATLAGVLEQLR